MSEKIDRDALDSWFRKKIARLPGSLEVHRFSGGQSNPTYLLATDERKYVLRKKPNGALLPSAHAIDCECRVMQALENVGVPVPRILAIAMTRTSSALPSM
jgi:aminoglycoside phosphotransferase (APT) family kinase protein